MKTKKVFKDVFINLIAASICTAALNLVVYPIFANRYTTEDYGNILTLIGVINLLWAVLGNTLNNTRLVLNRNRECNNESGTYNLIIMIVSVLGGIISVVIMSFFAIKTLISTILVFLTVVVGIARVYYVVSYRLKLDYIAQLKTNIIVSTGYIAGALITHSINWWPLPLLLGEGIAFIYTINKGTLISEPFCLADNQKIVLSTYSDLIITGLIGNIIAYFDRFLINPLLGASSVAIFSVAAFWGKAVTPFISPTANVMLSYLSQKDSKITLRKYLILFFSSVIPLLLFGVIGIWGAPLITRLLYPSLIESSMPYIFIASMGSLAQSSTLLLMPVLLSVCSSRKILVIQIIYFIIYLIIAYIGACTYGLMGFCIATCIIGVIKTVLYFAFGYFELRNAVL